MDLPRAYLVASVRVPYARAARAFFTSRVYLHSWIPVKFMYVELLSMIEKLLIELDFLPIGEAPFSKCHRLSGWEKSNSIGNII